MCLLNSDKIYQNTPFSLIAICFFFGFLKQLYLHVDFVCMCVSWRKGFLILVLCLKNPFGLIGNLFFAEKQQLNKQHYLCILLFCVTCLRI